MKNSGNNKNKKWSTGCQLCCMDCFIDMTRCLGSCISKKVKCSKCKFNIIENEKIS